MMKTGGAHAFDIVLDGSSDFQLEIEDVGLQAFSMDNCASTGSSASTAASSTGGSSCLSSAGSFASYACFVSTGS
jgi:hypothetical protein